MQIAFHIGANCTDEDKLIKSILKNADTFLQVGTAVPGPGRYRSLIRETIAALDGAKPKPDTRDVLIDTIVENDNVKRVVMSNGNFICIPNRIFEHGLMYSQAEPKVAALHRLFPKDEISLFMGLRNPVTFLQETFKRAAATTLSEYLGLVHPHELRWVSVIKRIKRAAPDTPLTVWCNEDTPLLWEQLIRQIGGVTKEVPVSGGLDILATVLTEIGLKQLQRRLETEKPSTDIQRHEIIADIWEQHALEDQVEDEIDLSELPPGIIQQMIDTYDEDLAEIAEIPGVKLLMPFS